MPAKKSNTKGKRKNPPAPVSMAPVEAGEAPPGYGQPDYAWETVGLQKRRKTEAAEGEDSHMAEDDLVYEDEPMRVSSGGPPMMEEGGIAFGEDPSPKTEEKERYQVRYRLFNPSNFTDLL